MLDQSVSASCSVRRKTRLARKAEQWLLIQLLPLTPRLQLVR